LESPKPITNALSGVQKDNLVLMDGHPDGRPRNTLRSGRVPELGVANALDCDGYLRTGARPRDELGKPQLLPIGYRRIRRLTPTECERLQGFPDGWTEGVSDTQRYKLLGNAVTTNVIAFLGEKLKGCIE
jgi:site-specific DNA-cytosine methylase